MLALTVSSAFTVNNGSLLSERWYFDRRFSTPILAIVFILPLLMLKNIGSLSYTRSVSICSISTYALYVCLSVRVALLDLCHRCTSLQWYL